MNRKILMIGVLLLAVCISVSAVSAEDDDDWSFSFSSSESSNSDGGSVTVENNVVTIQGFKFTIPDGYVENESDKEIGKDADQDAFPGFKESTVAFDKGEESILITVIYGDTEINDDAYTPGQAVVSKELADQSGWFEKLDNGVTFDFIEDGKFVHIFAPDEATLISLIGSSNLDD